jgi:hypothetical protein
VTTERALAPLRGYLQVEDWQTGDLCGRVRVGGAEYVVRGQRAGREWTLELILQPPEVRRVL